MILVTNAQIKKSLEKLDSENNSSPDQIPKILLKYCSNSLGNALTRIFNVSLITGKIPSIWKHSIVVPIPKSGKNNIVTNFRPISLTCSTSKILEQYVFDALYEFFESKNLIPSNQHGFMKNRSVDTQLIEVFDDFTYYLEDKKFIDVIYFDFKKAFDCVPHDILLEKLQRAGVEGSLLSWIYSFLSGRTFTVKVGSSFSDQFPASSGVPQGSRLGPLLFNFFISDLSKSCETEGVIIKKFADDIKSYLVFSELYETNSLAEFIKKLMFWCKNNKMTLSETKCEVLHLGKGNPERPYSLNRTILPVVYESIRDLGLFVTPDLKWTFHIEKLCAKANKSLYLLFKCLRSNNSAFLTKMYITYVRPILETSSVIFDPHLKKDIELIESVQRRATRMIFARCLRNDYVTIPSYEDRLKKLGLRTLEYRRIFKNLVIFYKILNKHIKLNSKTNFTWQEKNIKTRGSKHKLQIPKAKTSLRANSFLIKTADLFVKLPTDCQTLAGSPSLPIFKKNLTKVDNLVRLSRNK